MRLTIIKKGGIVSIDGEAYGDIDMSSLPTDFHAFQWFGAVGDIELRDANNQVQNVAVDDLSLFGDVIDGWKAAKAAVLPPPDPEPENPVPESITRRQCAMIMFSMGMISGPEAIAMTQSGIPPAAVQAYLDTLPEPQRTMATMDFAASNYFRDNQLLDALMAANNMTDQQVDEFFVAAAQL